MIRFNNDYNHGALDSILSALTATNTDSFAGYGEDIWCQRAETVIKQLVSSGDALIKFVPGATQANLVVIAAALSPIHSVIAADTGHINCHEAASIENTGHKILALPNTDGKITAGQIAARAAAYYDGGTPEYLTEPSPRKRGRCIPLRSCGISGRSAKNTACICSWMGREWATVWGRWTTI